MRNRFIEPPRETTVGSKSRIVREIGGKITEFDRGGVLIAGLLVSSLLSVQPTPCGMIMFIAFRFSAVYLYILSIYKLLV